MRWVVGLVGLLVVLALVMVAARQSLPAAGERAGRAPVQQVEQVRQDVQRALEQGAARASDALP